MTRREDEPAGLAEKVGEVARLEEKEAKEWWQAAERGDQSQLPEGAPPVSELKPLDRAERDDLVRALFGVEAAQPKKRGSKTWIFGASSALAVAASILFLVFWPAPSLPRYEMSFTGGERVVRGGENTAETRTLTAGSGFEVVLRPNEPVKDEAQIVGIFSSTEHQKVSWKPKLERSPDGALRAKAIVGRDLELAPGKWRLEVQLFANEAAATPAQTFDLHLEVKSAIGDPQ